MEGKWFMEDRLWPGLGLCWHWSVKGMTKRPSLDDTSTLTSRTMLTRALQRICATPSSVTACLGEGHQGPLLRTSMRMFSRRPRGPESCCGEPRLSTHSSVCLPPLGLPLPQKLNMNFSCPVESPLTHCNSHVYLGRLLRLIYNEVVRPTFV